MARKKAGDKGYTSPTAGQDNSGIVVSEMDTDDEGRFPDEPGYMQGPDWRPPFQTADEGDLTDDQMADLMDDSNFDTGGNYIGPEDVGNYGEQGEGPGSGSLLTGEPKSNVKGGVGRIGGTIGKKSRRQMSTGSTSAGTLLAP